MANPAVVSTPPPLRLRLDAGALVANYRALAALSAGGQVGAETGVETGAAVKADGYGLGARAAAARLRKAGCRNFFVAHWAEAAALSDIVPPEEITVLNGVGAADMPAALAIGAVPMLNSPDQIVRWKNAGGGRCHVMVDSGINRLGLGMDQVAGGLASGLFTGLQIDILASHLACADEDVPQNAQQLAIFNRAAQMLPAKRRSMASSAGIMLGAQYHFDLTRPGLALYGGIARPEMAGLIQQVVFPQAQVLQLRKLPAGAAVGYGASHICAKPTRAAIIAIGYADGYARAFSNRGGGMFDGARLPVIGRVSMDLVILDASQAENLREGDWINLDYELGRASAASGLSQYELLTGLGNRYHRVWA